jgi:hypothetical protein
MERRRGPPHEEEEGREERERSGIGEQHVERRRYGSREKV